MKDLDLYFGFISSAHGKSLDAIEPVMLSGWGVIEALWPLNQRFMSNAHQIRSLAYDPAFETEADLAIARLIENPKDEWLDISAEAWRVLLERLQQALVVAAANEAAGEDIMPVPPGLSGLDLTVAAALFWLFQMKLPWPPKDRSDYQVPAGGPPVSLRRH